jgi:hypothetical protein
MNRIEILKIEIELSILQTEIKGMEVDNQLDIGNQRNPRWAGHYFYEKAFEIKHLLNKLNKLTEIQEHPNDD